MNPKYTICQIIWLFLALPACKKTPPEDNQVKYGASDPKKLRQYSLLNIHPGETLYICASDPQSADMMAAAVEKWAVPINRKDRFTIKKTCEVPAKAAGYIEVIVDKKDDRCVEKKGLSEAYMSFYQTKARHGGQVVYCKSDWFASGKRNKLAHEAGHLWGLCDQYDVKNKYAVNNLHHPRCSKTYRSRQATTSLMNADDGVFQSRTTLTADDAEGMRVLAGRLDIPGNTAWRQFFSRPFKLLGPKGAAERTVLIHYTEQKNRIIGRVHRDRQILFAADLIYDEKTAQYANQNSNTKFTLKVKSDGTCVANYDPVFGKAFRSEGRCTEDPDLQTKKPTCRCKAVCVYQGLCKSCEKKLNLLVDLPRIWAPRCHFDFFHEYLEKSCEKKAPNLATLEAVELADCNPLLARGSR